MIALFLEAIAPCNLPLTALLGLVGLYWLLVTLGALDFDLDIVEFDLGDAGDVELGDSSGGSVHAGGAWISLGRTLGFRQVPLVVWSSFFVLFLWALAMLLNHTFNPGKSWVMAGVLLIPNALGSVLLTRLVVWPLGKVFTAMAEAQAEVEKVVGREAVVVSVEIDETYGQIEIANAGAPVRLNARTEDGQPPISRGETVLIVTPGPDRLFYWVRPVPSSTA